MSRRALALALLLCAVSPPAAQGALGDGVARLEDGLEDDVDGLSGAARDRLGSVPLLGPLSERIHLSGSWIGAHFESQGASPVPTRSFTTWDARFFVDLDLARDVDVGSRRILNSLGVSFEYEYVRLGRRQNQIGDLYADLQGVGGTTWLNVQVGRFQIPVGESYLRFGKEVRNNPFLSNTLGGAWWWDEGVRIEGHDPAHRFGYVASFTSGETPREWGLGGGGQATLKLIHQPLSWLRLSGSFLWSGEMGSDANPGQGALWLGEAWARPFGQGAPPPWLDDGMPVPPAPGRLGQTRYLGADVVARHPRGARLWLSYGSYRIQSTGNGRYDRHLHTWIAELVLRGSLISPEWSRFHLALRANGLGTYDRDKGYLLDVRYTGLYGYNLRALGAYSLAAGWRFTRWADLKLEYTYETVDTVRGAADPTDGANYFATALGFHF